MRTFHEYLSIYLKFKFQKKKFVKNKNNDIILITINLFVGCQNNLCTYVSYTYVSNMMTNVSNTEANIITLCKLFVSNKKKQLSKNIFNYIRTNNGEVIVNFVDENNKKKNNFFCNCFLQRHSARTNKSS